MDKDKITVTLESGKLLKISGSREAMKQEAGPNVVKRERMVGKFERAIELPAECKSDGISASYKNGVLEVRIPKKETAKPEMIKVTVQ
jgi:HSP20 family protein